MDTRRKAALWVFGALALLGAVGIFTLHAFIDPEHLKRIAHDKVLAATGRELTLGDLSFELLPMPALHAEEVTLGPAPGAGNRRAILARSIDARIALLPLLTGKVRVKGLALDGVQVAFDAGNAFTRAAGEGASNAGESLLDLESLRITDSNFTWRAKGSPPVAWHVVDASIDVGKGLRDAVIEATIQRNRHPLTLKARLDDLSKFGLPGAVSQGHVEATLGANTLAIDGRVPLEAALRGHALDVALKLDTTEDAFAFFGMKHRLRAPLAVRVHSEDSDGALQLSKILATLGKLQVTGEARISPFQPRPAFTAKLVVPRLDWAQAMLDAGQPPVPPLPAEELFHSTPYAWPLLVALQGKRGNVDAAIGALKLRNGLELTQVKAVLAVEDDRLDVAPFAAQMLGGTASGTMRFEGRKRQGTVRFEGANLLLERWFRERGSKIPFTGGPMKVDATLTATGANLKEFAASATGTAKILMGPGVLASDKAGNAEALLMSAPGSRGIEFQCVGALLPFRDGRATGPDLLGARSAVSNLLTSGSVDLREETLDLRGRMKPRGGPALATVAGDVKITGLIRKPHMALAKPAAATRVGVAIATFGISAVGTAIADASDEKNNPCQEAARASRARR